MFGRWEFDLIFDVTVKILWSSQSHKNKDICRFYAIISIFLYGYIEKPRLLTIPLLAIYGAFFYQKLIKEMTNFFEIDAMKITFVFTLYLQFILINIQFKVPKVNFKIIVSL